MLIGTHTLLPVCLAAGIDNIRLLSGKDPAFSGGRLAMIGFFGALPDLCSPHLSLEARYSSWSHTLVFLAALLPLCGLITTLFPDRQLGLFAGCWLAAALHLGTDAVAGGIPWLLPWSHSILGSYLIDPSLWLASDILFVAGTAALLGMRRRLAG